MRGDIFSRVTLTIVSCRDCENVKIIEEGVPFAQKNLVRLPKAVIGEDSENNVASR